MLGESTDEERNPWLDAWSDPCGGLFAFSSSLALCDPKGSGDHMLVVADLKRNLKIYRNTSIYSTLPLLGTPSACHVLWPDKSSIPALAIPCGKYVYMYRNLRPYNRFCVPSQSYDEKEKAIWEKEKWSSATYQKLLLLSEKHDISPRSHHYLTLKSEAEQMEFFEANKKVPFERISFVCCSTTLQVDSQSSNSRSCLVLGTETKLILVMKETANEIQTSIAIPDVPSIISCCGTLNVEYRLFIATRNNVVYIIKNGQLVQTTMTAPSTICCMCSHTNTLYIACTDHKIYVRHFKGQLRGTLSQPAAITALDSFENAKTIAKQVLIVGLKNGEVRTYVNKVLVHTMKMGVGISAMISGTYGRAESALIIVTMDGNLMIKLLKRNYDFNTVSTSELCPIEQETPIELPKISQLYLEQTEREKEKALTMHRAFQKDIMCLRVKVYDNYVKVLKEGIGPVSHYGKFKLSIDVLGLGPVFKLKFEVSNNGKHAAFNLFITLSSEDDVFEFVSNSVISVPVLIPGLKYEYSAVVRNTHPDGASARILVHLVDVSHTQPQLSALVETPVVVLPVGD